MSYARIINLVCQLDTNSFLCTSNISVSASALVPNSYVKEIHKCYFRKWISMPHLYQNKFHFIDKCSSQFYYSLHHEDRQAFLSLFYKIQRIYHLCCRLAIRTRAKKIRNSTIVTADLQLNPISESSANVIPIHHVNALYLFTISDLLTIIYNSLTNQYLFFSEPISVKNPYNNVVFGKSIFYYLYSKLRDIGTKHFLFAHIDVFYKFKECGFDLARLLYKYEYMLREYSIWNYVNNNTKQTLYTEIMYMIDVYNARCSLQRHQIRISDDFPKEELITIMRPYLYLKLVGQYSLIPIHQRNAQRELDYKMYRFQRFNPLFGRQTMVFTKIFKNGRMKKVFSKLEYNTHHIPFYIHEINQFMNSHLQQNTPLFYVSPFYNRSDEGDEDGDEGNEGNEDEDEDNDFPNYGIGTINDEETTEFLFRVGENNQD